ncbi:MAG: ATP-binding protein [Egibacteraceae bacterium]
MIDYLPRIVDDELDVLLSALPALSLEGPKGVGKTATALRRAETVYRLDEAGQRAIAAAEPARLVRGPRPVLIDEWQRLPESWDVVRRAVDTDPGPGQYLLTGSAAPLEQPTHSGAGRIVTLRMRPLTLTERGIAVPTVSLGDLLSGRRAAINGSTDVSLSTYAEQIVASGFPALRRLTGRALRAQLDGYLARIAERDFPELDRRIRNPSTLRRWMTAYAAATSTSASYETIRDAATAGEGDKPARTTTQPYRDVLERLWIVEPVPAWLPTRNTIARLSSPPKHHLADPSLAARLLGADVEALLDARPLGPPIPRDGTLLGHMFESLVTLCVRVAAQAAEAQVKHLRTQGGAREIDLIVERADHRVLAIEVKLGQTVTDDDVRHLHWLAQTIGTDLLDAAVVHTGREAYRRTDGIAVVPAALLGP